MMVIPAIDIMRGQTVQLVGGKPKTARWFGDPMEWASKFASEGIERLHIIDLDSAFDPGKEERPHLPLKLARDVRSQHPGIKVQLGGGLRTTESVEQALSNADLAIVGTRAVQDQNWLEGISSKWPGRIIVAVDVRAGIVQTHAWTQGSGLKATEFSKRVEKAGVRSVLYTHVDVEGQLKGIDIKSVQEATRTFNGIDLIWAGGVSSLGDVQALRDEKVFGCVLGSCLYFDKVRLKEALRTARCD
jgi:phosphoribosylformimino-5-aminoimidazole carboxamide ribotide isomerase